jgi:hypothetical protein
LVVTKFIPLTKIVHIYSRSKLRKRASI